ncbi:MAG: response regulator transcription factor [Erysipelotrichaceae bacterium]|nr:response regulator transcription factor [Erysipelotrichaceae bacterium]
MKIAIIDDDTHFQEDLKSRLDSRMKDAEISCFSSVEDVLDSVWDAVFLNIDRAGSTSGLKDSEKLRATSRQADIVYVTGCSDQYIEDIFLQDSRPAGVLLKPVDDEKLDQIVTKLESAFRQQFLTISWKSQKISIPAYCIMYLESDDHYVRICCKRGTVYRMRSKLGDIQKLLPDNFVRCHQSFLVNLDYISTIEKNTIFLTNGTSIPVSRAYKKGLSQIWVDCLVNRTQK